MVRVVRYAKKSVAVTTAIQPRAGRDSTATVRRVPRQEAQCQMPSQSVAHSRQSIFVHDMQRANAGRCWCTAHRWTSGVIGVQKCSGEGVLALNVVPLLRTRHAALTTITGCAMPPALLSFART